MKEQKFHRGDLVHITVKDASMSHFTSDIDAIVIGSYADQFGGGPRGRDHYTVFLKGHGQCSWYYDHQFTLLEANRADLLAEWERAREEEHTQKGDLDWVFQHGPEVLQQPHHASIQALATCLGIRDLWGSRGEGLDYWANSQTTLHLAAPFLETRDRAGWESYRAGGKG